jgi:hypothetical protein
MELEFVEHVRKPFVVEAIEVTTENIGELAQYIGTLRYKDDKEKTPYIAVDRRLIPNVYRVYTGFWMTRMGDNIRCYSRKIFMDQFIAKTDEMNEWIDWLTGAEVDEVNVTV